MSAFDKYAAQLVSDIGDVVPMRVRRKILENVNAAIDIYQHLVDLTASQDSKGVEGADKKKPRVPKTKNVRHRRANVAPLFPTTLNESSSAAATTNEEKNKKMLDARPSRENSRGVGLNGGLEASAVSTPLPTSARSALSTRKKVSVGARRYVVQIQDIDFDFAEVVRRQLQNLESSASHAEYSMTGTKLPLEEGKSPSSSVGKRLLPPPLDHSTVDNSKQNNSGTNGMAKPIPRSLNDTGSYQETFADFKFGRQRAGIGKSSTSSNDSQATKEREVFIDDHEDERRRNFQKKRPSRTGISDSSLDIDEARIANFPTTPKSQEKLKTISRVLVRHFLFSTLDDVDIATFASIMDMEEFKAGTQILEKGNPNDTFFIVLDGEAETTMVNEDGVEVLVPLVRGSTIGDLGLMYEVSNTASVVARAWVQCASLERHTYKMITSRAMEKKHSKYIDFLSSLSLFAELSPQDVSRVAEYLKEDVYVKGQRIIAAGEPSHWFHIVIEGTLSVMVHDDKSGNMKEVTLLRRGDCAGHIEFIYHHLPVADVVVVSAAVKTAKLSRRSFDLIPTKARERLIKCVQEEETYTPYHQRMSSATPPPPDRTPPFDAPPIHLVEALRPLERS